MRRVDRVRGKTTAGAGLHWLVAAFALVGGIAAPGSRELAIALARAVEDGALLLSVGMIVLGWLGRRPPAVAWARFRPGLLLGTALTGGLLVILGEAFNAAPTPTASAMV